MAKKCPACNADNKDGALVCEYCGTRLSTDKPRSAGSNGEKRFCSSCGKPLAPDAAFCPFCGAKRNDVAPAPIQDPAARQVPIPPRTPVSQGLPAYMQPGYLQQVRAAREAERQAARNASKTKKSTRGLSLFLSLLLAAQVCVAAFRYPGFLRGKIGVTQGKTDGESEEFAQDLDSLILDTFGLTEEDMKLFEDNMPEVTAENSPGNPAFIDVTFTQAEYDAARTLTASISREDPTADFPEFGIHVDLKSWNLQNEEDTLTVKRLPVKDDDATETTLYTYDFSLASGQHEFLTDAVITVPAEGENTEGFVVFNEDTGKWEDAYCALSEDGKTLTAYMPHFSKGALRKVKEDAGGAISKYTVNGKSIFVQLRSEMKALYKNSSHHLYPVTVLKNTDFSNYIDKQKGETLEILKQMVENGGGIPKDSSVTRGANALGLVNDAAAQGTDALSKSSNVIKGTSENALGKLGPVMTVVGSIILYIKVSDQYERGVDTDTIVRDNWKGAAGCLVGAASAVVGATLTGTAGTLLSGALTLAGAGLFVWSAAEMGAEYVEKEAAPMGYPTCVQDVSYLTYLCENASNRGYLKRNWILWKEADLPSGIEPVDVYREEPEKVVDGRGNGWMNALKTLSDEYAEEPQRFFESFTKMYEDLSDAYFDESYEVRQKAFREGCKKYVRIQMRDAEGNFTDKIGNSKKYSFPSERADYNGLRKNSTALDEWSQLEVILAKTYEQNKNTHPGWTNDDLWNEIFRIWDEGGADYTSAKDEQSFLKTSANQEAAMKKNAIAALKRNTHEAIAEFFHNQRRGAIKEARKYVYDKVLPLLNTRLTFWSQDRSVKEHTFEEIAAYQFSFKNVGSPRFYPANAGQAAESSPLLLKANKDNKVLLETTVYHYLRFDCPTEVSVKGEKQSVDGKAEWTRRNLVTDVNTGRVVSLMENENISLGSVELREQYNKEFEKLQTGALDTKIPVSFELEEDEEEGAGQTEDKTGSAGQTGTGGKEKTGYWKLAEDPWSEESDALKNKIYNDATLSGSAVNGFTGTSTYLGNDYRLGVSEKEQTHEGHCTGEKGTAVTTFSQPPSTLPPEEVLSIDVKVSYSKSDGHPQGVNLQTTIRFMWEPHASSYTYLRTDDDQYNIMPQQEHTTEGGKDTGYHTFSSYSKNNEATLKGTVPKGNTGSQSDLYICFSGTLSAYQINTYYHYVWVEE